MAAPLTGKFLKSWVATQADILAMVGDRVSPHVTRQGKGTPRITYQVLSNPRIGSLLGHSGIIHPTVLIACQSTSYDEADQLALKVAGTQDDERLDKFSGTVGGVECQGAHVLDGPEEIDDPEFESDVSIYTVGVVVEIWLSNVGSA